MTKKVTTRRKKTRKKHVAKSTKEKRAPVKRPKQKHAPARSQENPAARQKQKDHLQALQQQLRLRSLKNKLRQASKESPGFKTRDFFIAFISEQVPELIQRSDLVCDLL